MKSQKTIPRNRDKKQITTAIVACIMLLTPLLFLGEGLGVRCLAQANGTGAGNCLSYDGSSNYVDITNSEAMSYSSITVEAWVYYPNLIPGGFEKAIISKHFAGSGYGYGLFANSNNNNDIMFLVGYTSGAATISTTQDFSNAWHHIAGVYDNSNGTMKLYVDGVEKATGSANPIVNLNQTILIGSSHQTGSYNYNWNGQIDEVRIYNRAETETEIRDNMCKKLTGSESGLVGYWRFDESSGGTAYDATTNGNDGTLY